eukprot:1031986-Rhodomonas_salina.1
MHDLRRIASKVVEMRKQGTKCTDALSGVGAFEELVKGIRALEESGALDCERTMWMRAMSKAANAASRAMQSAQAKLHDSQKQVRLVRGSVSEDAQSELDVRVKARDHVRAELRSLCAAELRNICLSVGESRVREEGEGSEGEKDWLGIVVDLLESVRTRIEALGQGLEAARTGVPRPSAGLFWEQVDRVVDEDDGVVEDEVWGGEEVESEAESEAESEEAEEEVEQEQEEVWVKIEDEPEDTETVMMNKEPETAGFVAEECNEQAGGDEDNMHQTALAMEIAAARALYDSWVQSCNGEQLATETDEALAALRTSFAALLPTTTGPNDDASANEALVAAGKALKAESEWQQWDPLPTFPSGQLLACGRGLLEGLREEEKVLQEVQRVCCELAEVSELQASLDRTGKDGVEVKQLVQILDERVDGVQNAKYALEDAGTRVRRARERARRMGEGEVKRLEGEKKELQKAFQEQREAVNAALQEVMVREQDFPE